MPGKGSVCTLVCHSCAARPMPRFHMLFCLAKGNDVYLYAMVPQIVTQRRLEAEVVVHSGRKGRCYLLGTYSSPQRARTDIWCCLRMEDGH